VKKIIKVKFRGIDSHNRPIFKAINCNDYFGSVYYLFGKYEDPDKIVEFFQYHLDKLVYFGSHFDCEPMGLPLNNVRLELA
jgi:hypothetical protein